MFGFTEHKWTSNAGQEVNCLYWLIMHHKGSAGASCDGLQKHNRKITFILLKLYLVWLWLLLSIAGGERVTKTWKEIPAKNICVCNNIQCWLVSLSKRQLQQSCHYHRGSCTSVVTAYLLCRQAAAQGWGAGSPPCTQRTSWPPSRPTLHSPFSGYPCLGLPIPRGACITGSLAHWLTGCQTDGCLVGQTVDCLVKGATQWITPGYTVCEASLTCQIMKVIKMLERNFHYINA